MSGLLPQGAITDDPVYNLRAGSQPASEAGNVYPVLGVPPVGLGVNGDLAVRIDGGAGTTIYQKRAGAWVATAA